HGFQVSETDQIRPCAVGALVEDAENRVHLFEPDWPIRWWIFRPVITAIVAALDRKPPMVRLAGLLIGFALRNKQRAPMADGIAGHIGLLGGPHAAIENQRRLDGAERRPECAPA